MPPIPPFQRYLAEQGDLEAGKLLEAEVPEAERPVAAQALQQLLEVPPVGQRERAAVVLHLDEGFLRSLLAHRHNHTVRLQFGLEGREK